MKPLAAAELARCLEGVLAGVDRRASAPAA
jgi:hypothetical protein